jgi:hypothetical protein
MMGMRGEFAPWFTEKKDDDKIIPCSASRLCYGSLRSPSRRHEAEPPPLRVSPMR